MKGWVDLNTFHSFIHMYVFVCKNDMRVKSNYFGHAQSDNPHLTAAINTDATAWWLRLNMKNLRKKNATT